MSAEEQCTEVQNVSHTEPEPVDISLELIIRRHFSADASSWSGEKIAEKLHKVTHVRLDREHIGSIDNLLLFSTNVTNVYIQHNKIENLDGLAFLVNLRFLTAAYNHIQNISGIADLQFLSFVDLSNNKVSDISELPTSIVILNLLNNPCTENAADYRRGLLARLPQLKQLDNVMLNMEESSDDDDDVDDDDDENNAADESKSVADASHRILSVEDCSVRNVADTILERSQMHLEEQFAEHKRRLVQLNELRAETPRPLSTKPRPLTASDAPN